MRIRLRRVRGREIDHEIIWGSIGLLVLLVSRFLPTSLLPALSCPFHAIAGIPCLTCGMTRSFLAFARGDAARAFALNPLGAILFAGLVLYVPYAAVVVILDQPRLRLTFSGKRSKTAARIAVASALLANWIYLIAAGR